MGNGSERIKLYTTQQTPVLAAIERDGAAYSKREYVVKKYQESAPIFTTAYSWFVEYAQRIVPRPEGAEYPYWAFADPYNVDAIGGSVQRLEVPREEAVFFDTMDWNKILRLSYIGETEEEEQDFVREMENGGMNYNDIMLTGFYPVYKRRVMKSWERLFRHHEEIKYGDASKVHSIQAGLWRIKKEWLRDL